MRIPFQPTFQLLPPLTAAKYLYRRFTTEPEPDVTTDLPDTTDRTPPIPDVRDSGPSRCCCTTCPRCWPASQPDTMSDCLTCFPFIPNFIPTSKQLLLCCCYVVVDLAVVVAAVNDNVFNAACDFNEVAILLLL